MKRRVWLGLILAFALVVAACGDDDDAATTTAAATTTEAAATTEAATTTEADDGDAVLQRDFRFVVVSHGQSSDPFWSVAANGVGDAAEDMGVEGQYQAPGTFDMVEMSSIIDAAVASQPDGLVITLPDAEALGTAVRAAVEAGIPVISMNSGSDDFADLGILVHVGQTEYAAGLIAGQRFAAADVRLLSPILPSKVVGVGKNYAEHVQEMNTGDAPKEPLIFLKPSTTVIGPGDAIRIPAGSTNRNQMQQLCRKKTGWVQSLSLI